MKTLGLLLCCFFSILSSRTLAQDVSKLPPDLNKGSTLSEVVDWLDKNSFSHARIGLESDGPESYTDSSDPMNSINLSLGQLSEGLFFSSGFRLVKTDGCGLTLRNDDVKILRWWTKSYDSNQMSLANFVFGGKKGEKKLTPQSAVLFIPLNKMRESKKPYQYTKKAEEAKSLGTWRTKFKEKGFFKLSVFKMEISAAEDPELKGKMQSGTLTFTFDDKEESQRFDAAIRQAIKLCSAK
jgi:hypothetical protein